MPMLAADGTVQRGELVVNVSARRYLDRSRHRKGMAYGGGILVRAFAKAGWRWGGRWPGPTDYQHFSATGR
jgi:hypothetical protein